MSDQITPVPTLSTLGYITDAVKKFDFLLSHFFLSDYNQTYLYKGHVTSLTRIIENSGNHIESTILGLTNGLKDYLKRYYLDADVKVTTPDTEVSNIELTISITVTEAGSSYTFMRLLEAVDGKMQKIVKINNTGN